MLRHVRGPVWCESAAPVYYITRKGDGERNILYTFDMYARATSSVNEIARYIPIRAIRDAYPVSIPFDSVTGRRDGSVVTPRRARMDTRTFVSRKPVIQNKTVASDEEQSMTEVSVYHAVPYGKTPCSIKMDAVPCEPPDVASFDPGRVFLFTAIFFINHDAVYAFAQKSTVQAKPLDRDPVCEGDIQKAAVIRRQELDDRAARFPVTPGRVTLDSGFGVHFQPVAHIYPGRDFYGA